MKLIHILPLLLLMTPILCGCHDEVLSEAGDADAVELNGIQAEIASGGNYTRAITYLEDHISRHVFEANDEMVFTKVQRTEHTLSAFKYREIAFDYNASGAWERDKTTGYAGEGTDQISGPERIYWSDATSAHTFIGYSLPKDNTSFDWKKSSYYYETDGNRQNVDTYYGAIGDPTNAAETINYNTESKQESVKVEVNGKEETIDIKYSQALRDEDLLLTYNTNLVADNSLAKVEFYHALSSVRVIVNISGFYGSAVDSFTVVSDMKLLDQPVMYRWNQASHDAVPLINALENNTLHQTELWGEENTVAPQYNQQKDMILWNADPNGQGFGSSKTFTFFGITVPQESDFFSVDENKNKDLELKFKVTYPDPLKNDPRQYTISKWYNAVIPAHKTNGTDNHVYFHPGQCTTIKVTLNHKDETMTVGASYMDWEYVETPDEGNLKKKSTFLQSAPTLGNRAQAKITICADAGATEDDATWLYQKKENNEVVDTLDIYGNNGSVLNPYTISTAEQLLSFAYEVKNGMDFSHKYVKLDADITLQKGYAIPTYDNGEIKYSELIRWIGIGDESHVFNGFFLGSGRHINNLYGEHFFYSVGANAVIDKLNFDNIIEVQGCGVVAHENNGLICGCYIDGDVKETNTNSQYTGSIVGTNNSFIIACAHVGKVQGRGTIGGLVGFNNGTIMASYHSGEISALDGSTNIHATIGKRGDGTNSTNNSIAFSCYYDKSLISHTPTLSPGKSGFPLTTNTMQSSAFVNADNIVFDYDSNGNYTVQAKTLRQAVLEILGDTYQSKSDAELIAELLKDGVTSTNVQKLFEYHFSLNEALHVFNVWLNAIAASAAESVQTNCHDFSRLQILFLQQHYNAEHKYIYTPASYPKVQ